MFKKVIVFALLSIIIACDCQVKRDSSGYEISYKTPEMTKELKLIFECELKCEYGTNEEPPIFNYFKCDEEIFYLESGDKKKEDEHGNSLTKNTWKLNDDMCKKLNLKEEPETIKSTCLVNEVYPFFKQEEGNKYDVFSFIKMEKEKLDEKAKSESHIGDKTRGDDICNKTKVKNLIV